MSLIIIIIIIIIIRNGKIVGKIKDI